MSWTPERVSAYERVLRRTRSVPSPSLDFAEDCLLFEGRAGNADYSEEAEDHGKIRVWRDGRWKLDYAHRVSYEYHYGAIPEKLVVRHLCHRRRCVEKTHLVTGTNSDNMLDMMKAQRGKNQFKSNDDCPF